MKKTTFLRLSALLLAVLTLCLASCGETDRGKTETTTEAAAQTTVTAEDTTESLYDENGYLKDKIPADTNLNTTLSMLYWSDVENQEFFAEDETGETVNDAIYKRNLTVEGRLNVKFEYTGIPGNYNNNANFNTEAKTANQGGTIYDIYAAYSMTTASLAYNGLCRNMLNYEILDFSQPWWPDGLITEAKIDGKLFFAAGDLSTNLLYMLYPIYFNKDLISQYRLDNPYDLVKSDSWTFDKMFEMASIASTNGSVGTGDEAVIGYAQGSSVHSDAWFYAAGLRTVDKNDDGSLKVSDLWGGDKANEVATKVQQFLNADYSVYSSSDSFTNGNAIFILDRARYASKWLTEATFEYGVVPMPKYNADQENYSTCLGFPYTLYAISTSSSQPEAVATALECLCSEGYRTITPALFELTMKTKYASDSDAGQMFDIIRETASFDVGRIYNSQMGNLSYSIFRSFVNSSTLGSYSTSFTTQVRVLNKYIEKLQNTFSAIDG